MKKIVRLTESDLVRLVKRVINEQAPPPDPWGCIDKWNKENNHAPLNPGSTPNKKWETGNDVDGKKTYLLYYDDGRCFHVYEENNQVSLGGTWKCKGDNGYTVKWATGGIHDYETKSSTSSGTTQSCTSYVQNDATIEDLKTGKKVAKKCDKGEIVIQIQKRLKTYYQKELGGVFDPKFGNKTESAVKKFQAKMSLKDDGIVGKRTAKALFPDTSTNTTTKITNLTYAGGLKPEIEAQAKEAGDLQQSLEDLFWKDEITRKRYMENPNNLQ